MVLMSLVLGCEAKPTTPVQVYNAFYQAVANEDWDLATTYLSPRVIKTFSKVGAELQSMVGDDGDSLDFFLQGIRAHVRTPLVKVEQIDKTFGTARLKVVAGQCQKDSGSQDCFESEVSMVFISGRWYVDPKLPPMGVEDQEPYTKEKPKDKVTGSTTGG